MISDRVRSRLTFITYQQITFWDSTHDGSAGPRKYRMRYTLAAIEATMALSTGTISGVGPERVPLEVRKYSQHGGCENSERSKLLSK